MIFQRILERLPIRGKGRLADAVLSHTASQEVVCHPIRGVTVALRTNQRIERWMWAGAYERDLVHLIKMKLRRGMTMLDVGANIGYFSAIAAGLVGDAGQVHAFEPTSQNFARLQKNVSPFSWAHPHALAVGETPGKVPIYSSSAEAGWSSLLNSGELEPAEEVEVIRLDDWVRERALKRIDFVKVDIEGSEVVALRGAKETLQRFKPTIVIEINSGCLARSGYKPADVLGLLETAGYQCNSFGGGNVLALPRTTSRG